MAKSKDKNKFLENQITFDFFDEFQEGQKTKEIREEIQKEKPNAIKKNRGNKNRKVRR